MYWYRQYPGKKLQLMFYSAIEQNVHKEGSADGFTAERPSDSDFNLESSDLKVDDSAMYYCAWSVHSLTGGLQPVQSPLRLVTAKDKLATINCNERESTPQSMLWYRQSAGQGLMLIGYIQYGGTVRYEEKDQSRFEITGDGDRNSVLKLPKAAPADSAMYFCATTDTQRCSL
ncbi:hypothetical protein chiPu_0012175 [Chiloscyllium punctatum]|uniref:Ig-like domain-containing protein n=1 Tax=Chiloscyllium punctatum TaxID=137246 RepID=A0A401STI2_CHIPU|nr:hypothetical protein [Chiloscyllium punctatum]